MGEDETTLPKGWIRRSRDGLSGLLKALGRWLIEKLNALWHWLHDLARVLWPCRVPVTVLVLAALGLLATPQGREVTLGLDAAGPLGQGVFFTALILWGFLGWLWARILLQSAFSIDRKHTRSGRDLPQRLRAMIDVVPRLIGIGSALTASAAFVSHWGGSQGNTYGFLALVSVALAGAAFWFFRARGHAVRGDGPKGGWLTQRLRQLAERGPFKERVPDHEKRNHYLYLRELPPFFTVVLYFALAAALMWLVLAGAKPAWTGQLLGAAAVAFLGFAFIVAVGSLYTFWSIRWGFPFDVTLLIAAYVFSFWVDNHTVRTTAIKSSPSPNARPTMEQALERWSAQFSAQEWDSQNPPPFIVVATAGGALRAAYWTTTVLGTIADEVPGFRKSLFAISGVSGGSLGAGTFIALLDTASHARWKNSGCKIDPARQYRDRARCILDADYLAPVLANLLTFDLVQRYLPWGFLPDRSWAIEQGWERGWLTKGVNTPDGGSPLAQPFLNIWPDGGTDALGGHQAWRPALLLNGTLVENGKRVITSNLRVEASHFVDAYDAHDLAGDPDVKADFTMSSAIDNSTRFPYVEPAGTLRKGKANNGHIVDGGYFENFGAETAAEVLHAAKHYFEKEKKGEKFRPIVIQISSDPGLERRDLPWCADSVEPRADSDRRGPHPVRGWHGANETLSPPLGLYAARTARGILATNNLCRDVAAAAADAKGHAPTFFHFRLCRATDRPDPGLGWLLSKESFDLIGAQLDERDCGNDWQLRMLLGMLRRNAHAGHGAN